MAKRARQKLVTKRHGPGGKRKNAGRPLGSATQRTREIANRIAADPSKIMPLEVMIDNMMFAYKQAIDNQAQFEAMPKTMQKDRPGRSLLMDVVSERAMAQSYAKDAAPYLHPRLNAIDVHNKGKPFTILFAPGDDKI